MSNDMKMSKVGDWIVGASVSGAKLLVKDEMDLDEVRGALVCETEGKNRKIVVAVIEARIEELEMFLGDEPEFISEKSADDITPAAGGGEKLLPLKDIQVVYNPRKKFGDKQLKELTASVKSVGVVQPLVVRLLDAGGYALVAGERRLRAARAAGLDEVPVVVRMMTEKEAVEIALVENLQRVDLDILEESEGFHDLMNVGWSVAEMVERFGRSKEYIYIRLELRKQSQEIKEAVGDGVVALKVARALGKIKDSELQAKALKSIINPQYQSDPLSRDSALRVIKNEFIKPQEDAEKWDASEARLTAEHPGVEFIKYGEKLRGYVCLDTYLGWDERDPNAKGGAKWADLAKKYKVPKVMCCGYDCAVQFLAKKSLMKTADAAAKKGWYLKRAAKELSSDEKLDKERAEVQRLQVAEQREQLKREWLKELFQKVRAGEVTKEQCMVMLRVEPGAYMGALEIILGVDFGEGWQERYTEDKKSQAMEMMSTLLEDNPGGALLGLLLLAEFEHDVEELYCSSDADPKYAVLAGEEGE